MDPAALLESIKHLPPWTIWIAIFLSPFVQEDAAVIGTATLTAMGKISLGPALAAIFAGLFFSDIWKYWIGWFALKNPKGRRLSKKDKVLSLKGKVEDYPFTTLMSARFIPLTRIPIYVACGFFKVNYLKFCLFIAFTAALYISIFFSAFHALGALMAEQLKWVLPIFGIAFALSVAGLHYFKSSRTDRVNPDP